MLINCKSISGKDVPENQRFSGESADTNYSPLVIGKEYFVFAIIFYSNRIDYLICPDDRGPMWAPSCLFSIVDSRLDSNFYTAVIEENGSFSWLYKNYGAKFIIGYQKITESFEHFVGLIERNEVDLIAFFKTKARVTRLDVENRSVIYSI